MTVEELIKELSHYNNDTEVTVIAHHTKHGFTVTYGDSEGVKKENAESVSFYVDALCSHETPVTQE